MSWRHLLRFLSMLALLCGAGLAIAADHLEVMRTRFPIPEHYKLVNDHAGMLRIARRVEITRKLEALEKRNGTQIVFLSVPNVGPDGIDAYGKAVLRQWDIGNNGQHNGVLFLICWDGWQMFTGGRIAGALPDVALGRLSRQILSPAWDRDALSDGIEHTIDAMIKASQAEDTLGTIYDYARAYVPATLEQKIAYALAALAAAYAAVLLWQRHRRRRQGGA